jgi:hypothetical protein
MTCTYKYDCAHIRAGMRSAVCTLGLCFCLYIFRGFCVCVPPPPLRGQHTILCHPRWLPTSGLTEFAVCWGEVGFEPRTTDSNPGLLHWDYGPIPYCFKYFHFKLNFNYLQYSVPVHTYLKPCKSFILIRRRIFPLSATTEFTHYFEGQSRTEDALYIGSRTLYPSTPPPPNMLSHCCFMSAA